MAADQLKGQRGEGEMQVGEDNGEQEMSRRSMLGAAAAALSASSALAPTAMLGQTVPGPLADDKKAVGGTAVESKIDYTFRMKVMKPNVENSAEARAWWIQVCSARPRGSQQHGEARRLAGVALASERFRVAVLHQRQRPAIT